MDDLRSHLHLTALLLLIIDTAGSERVIGWNRALLATTSQLIAAVQ